MWLKVPDFLPFFSYTTRQLYCTPEFNCVFVLLQLDFYMKASVDVTLLQRFAVSYDVSWAGQLSE